MVRDGNKSPTHVKVGREGAGTYERIRRRIGEALNADSHTDIYNARRPKKMDFDCKRVEW